MPKSFPVTKSFIENLFSSTPTTKTRPPETPLLRKASKLVNIPSITDTLANTLTVQRGIGAHHTAKRLSTEIGDEHRKNSLNMLQLCDDGGPQGPGPREAPEDVRVYAIQDGQGRTTHQGNKSTVSH